MVDRDVVEGDDVRAVVRSDAHGSTPSPPVASLQAAPGAARPTTLREFKEVSEREFLVEKLREFGWNISKTADVIDTPRSNLYKKLEQYGIAQETDG
jgi:two-component system nitrogen regulation response regulator NtrX